MRTTATAATATRTPTAPSTTTAMRTATPTRTRATGATPAVRPARPAAVPPSVLELLRRSDEELVAAQLAQDAHDRFRHGHLAALRAAAAVLPAAPARRRSRPRPVWEQLADVAPELAPWAALFADGAALRAAVEAGRTDVVTAERAERTLAAAEDFQDLVRERWGLPLTLVGVARAG
ncbi:SAV_6107 family HEPN domain-containing protein [Actinotalea sp. Marseille-Q4924]|uniref:SAV_6107 family HEPN domain-containing protein n=1 Tax=Actinotalea sp. Marseille-Q4924 TaxID=2866571 RepID=UPI001CE3C231|nr:SAV_6107 family HEPN domain-containing protein [Actinotalea sp. Marseille-Q4924]